MKLSTILFALIFFTVQTNTTFAQTQEEIETLMKAEKPAKEKSVDLKKELKKREKELALKEKNEAKATQEAVVAEKESKTTEVKEEGVAAKKKTKEKKSKLKETKQDVLEVEAEVKEDLNKIPKNKLKKVGDKLAKSGSYYNAIDYYKAALMKSKGDKDIIFYNYKLGEANFMLRDYKQAEKYYAQALEIGSSVKKYPALEYDMASTYKYLAKYDTAIAMYTQFETTQAKNKKLSELRKKSSLEKEGAVYALTLSQEDLAYEINNAGENVNGLFSDYGPELVGDVLYFSKIYTDKVVVLDGEATEKEFSKIYYSEIQNEEFGVFQDFAENVNTSKVHVGNPSFTADGNTLFFTECTITKDLKSTCKILKSQRQNNEWQKAEVLNSNINLEKSNNTQPQITKNAEGVDVLFFVSDRVGGNGGKDIWQSTMDANGQFGVATNNAAINTAYDDVSPFYHTATNTLYFSSNGRVSLGGFDVYKVENFYSKGENDTKVENLGYPFNSSFDDYDFVLNNDSDLGFIVSNRKGTMSLKSENCCDDLFVVKSTAIDLFISGLVYAENIGSRVLASKADLFLYNMTTKAENVQIPYVNGKPYFQAIEKDMDYKIIAVTDNFENVEISFSTKGIKKSDTLQYDVFFKERILQDYVIGKIYYQFDMSKLREDAPETLNKVIVFMNSYPETIVQVGSHTDSKGTDEYNMALSERRSLSVRNYLINVGKISKKRLENKWYGKSNPAAPNTKEDGSDNPEGRDLNRRTEFKVIGTLNK